MAATKGRCIFITTLHFILVVCNATSRDFSSWQRQPTTRTAASRTTLSSTAAAPTSGLNHGFVTAQGTTFFLNGKPWYCAGSNSFYAAVVDRISEDDVRRLFKSHASQGASVVRVFAHSDGYGFPNEMQTKQPIQPKMGEYNEEALKRLDLVLSEAAKNGIRLILPLSNYEPFLGGMQWYAEQVHGVGADKELFFTDPVIRDAYMAYVKAIIQRTNSITGVPYASDPTILAWELMNEPHTRDSYEKSRGIAPGTLVRNWIKDMAAYVKSLDSSHMLFTGEEGYRTSGSASEGQHSWVDNGLKGVDFAANCADVNIDACTVHAYPDNWGYKADEYKKYGPAFIKDRAAVAHSLGKPILMEEYGMKEGYLSSRNELLDYLQGEANDAGYACTLVWAADPGSMDEGSYIFGYEEDGSESLKRQYAVMKAKTEGQAVQAYAGPAGE